MNSDNVFVHMKMSGLDSIFKPRDMVHKMLFYIVMSNLHTNFSIVFRVQTSKFEEHNSNISYSYL